MFRMVGTSMLISFVAAFLSLNSIAFGFWNSAPAYVEMTPNNPIVIEYGTLVLNCTLTSQYKGPCNASDLYVRHSSMDFKYPDIQVIADRTAQYRLPNATIENNGRFSCELSSACCNTSVGLRNAQYIHVKRTHLVPYLTRCTVENWEFLVCSWAPNASIQSAHMSTTAKAVRQTLLWQHPGDGDNWIECPERPEKQGIEELVPEKCFWRSSSFTMKEEYCIKIAVSSVQLSNITSAVECLNPELIVKPNPPTISWNTSAENGKMLSVGWRAPTAEKVPLIYRVVVHSKWEVRNFTVVNDTWLNVSSVPNTEYHISIVAFPSERGYPSDRAVATLLSAPAVPSKNPFIMKNFYSVNIVDRLLVLYWLPILEENYCGSEFHYYVFNRTLRGPSGHRGCDSSCYSTSMTWTGFASDMLIVSKNKIGPALLPSQAIHVPSSHQLFLDIEVIAEGQDKNVLIDWFFKETYFDRRIESVMLFWCQPANFDQICQTPIRWQTINDMSQRDFNLTVDEEFKNFQFGASVKFSGSDYSGINWSRKRYSMTKLPDAPEGLKVSPAPGKHSELQVNWKEPRYSDFSAYIRSFAIFYCPVNHRNQCLSENQSVVIFKYRDRLRLSGDGVYTLKGLDPDAKYRVWMTSHSRHRSSKPSESVYGGTHQPWFTPGKIVGIVAGVLLASMVVVFGLYITFRCCDKYRKKLTSGFKVSLPQQRFQLSSTSSEAPVLKNQTELQYWRQPSQVSTGSHDSGHYSFPPSSPAMLPLLDKLKDQENFIRGRNCYQAQTNFTGIETMEDDEGSDGSALDIASYRIVPNVDVDVKKPQANQTQYILPDEINWMEGGTKPMNVGDCPANDANDGKVDYCNDFHFPVASDSSDIGYTKIEQIQTTAVSIPSNQPESCRGATNNRNEDPTPLFCFDHQPGELDSNNTQPVPPVSHLDELLATLSDGQSLTDYILVGTEASAVNNDNCPISATKTTEEELPLHSKQALSSVEVNFLDPVIIQGTGFQPGNNGYLPLDLLLGIE